MSGLYAKLRSQTAAFVLLAIMSGYALSGVMQDGKDTLYRSQVQACERGNLLRHESNRRIAAHNEDRDTLQEFLIAAREARRAAYKTSHEVSDANAVADYTRLIARLDTVKFEPVRIIDCKRVVTKP